MKKKKNYNVIGIMTGTSMDGVDISYCATNGLNKIKIFHEKSYNYSISIQTLIKNIKINNNHNKITIEKNDTKITKIIISYLKKFLEEFYI